MTKLNFKSSQKLKPEISRIINDMKKMETRRGTLFSNPFIGPKKELHENKSTNK